MKKLFFAALVAVFAMSSMNAQERDSGDIEAIPYIGYSSYYFNGDNVQNLGSIGSVAFGVKGDYYFNDRWSIRSGFMFDKMGAIDSNPTTKLSLNYLSIPVNANWHFGSTRKWNLNFGLSSSFLLSADLEGTDVKDQLNSTQLGLSYGIGYKIEVSDAFSIMIDSQNFFGFSNIIKDENADKIMNAGGSLSVGGVFVF